MKLYVVTATIIESSPEGAIGSSGARSVSKWVGSQKEVADTKRDLLNSGARKSSITVIDVEVPTDKKGLLGFLNEGKY